ncbi:hypothetical protein PHYSODRAFT_247548 [Phytophthora sojae]|uniref:Uncharacterized protein n=1 Tax=Phytophthora sojae (strain P6497) TaxID=1094619 RepID=G5AFN5_PHYSP|nr:hypothetical protein PHYSODRAFT_247548 [Phytophthora sojae]EGZ06025.1 hypothetical protein PHYSODRAFT_247548 [Phytophthora sojae]|eukprot:XP_009538886.1 hypothetical protein PHYSODRAFT_247548 [Phytophthora sojae]
MEAAVDDPLSVDSSQSQARGSACLSQREAARQQDVPRWILNDWRKAEDDIVGCAGSEKRLSRGPGRPEMVPFGAELVTFMKDTRRDCEVLTAKVMASFVRDQYPDWLAGYVDGKKNAVTAYDSLVYYAASLIATGSCSERQVASR